MIKKTLVIAVAGLALGLLLFRMMGGEGVDGEPERSGAPAPPGANGMPLGPVSRGGTGAVRQELGAEGTGDLEENVEPVAIAGGVTLSSADGWPSSTAGVTLCFAQLAEGDGHVEEAAVRDGRWTVRLRPGTWQLSARKESMELDVTPASLVVEGGSVGRSLVVQARAAVRARLQDCAGNGIAGVRARLDGPQEFVGVSDSTGLLVLPAEGMHRVLMDPESLPPGTGVPWWQTSANSIQRKELIEGTIGGEVRELTLGSLVDVRGIALSHNGHPLSNATVSLRSYSGFALMPNGANYVLQTDEGGRFEAQMSWGNYVAWYFPPPGFKRARPDPVHFELGCGDASRELTLQFTGGLGGRAVYVQVQDSSGGAMDGHFGVYARISMMGAAEQVASRGLQHAKASGTATHGFLEFLDFPEGAFILVRTKSVSPEPDLVYVDESEYLEFETAEDITELTYVVDAYAPSAVRVVIESAEVKARRPRIVRMEGLGPPRSEFIDLRSPELTFDGLAPGEAMLTVINNDDGIDVVLSSKLVPVVPGEETLVVF